jgi:hypothetical protein
VRQVPVRRPKHAASAPESLGDRLVAAGFGAFVGAGFGFLVALLLTGTSRYISYGEYDPSFQGWMIGTGAVFALLGLVLGSRAAELLGQAISGVLHAEAYAYWWYWGLRGLGLTILIGVAVSMVKQLFK